MWKAPDALEALRKAATIAADLADGKVSSSTDGICGNGDHCSFCPDLF